ncbi:MAG: hypothetical protein RMK45_01820 [Armatimonadota bacterium]|nr:hypothetical protein [Armatimonadota bacterium]
MNSKARNSASRCYYGWLLGAAAVAATLTALAIIRRLQERQTQPEYRAERAYQRGLKQVQAVEERIPRWLAERS